MNPVRILATADVHFDRENQVQALASLQALYQHGRDNGVDLWVIAGDLFNRAVPNTGAAGFPLLVAELQRMMNIAPVVAVRGTPTHDIDGCYEALQEINAEFGFTVLDPRRSCFLGTDGEVGEDTDEPRLLILGCGEPSKEWFLADKEGLGREEATQAVKDGMRQLLLGLGATRKQYAELPCLMVYHGAIEGASLCNGQTLRPGELAIGRDDLALVGADYYALGHIHLAQQVGNLPAYYAGSAYPVNWGEVDRKSFYAVELAPGAAVVPFAFPHPRRSKHVWTLGESVPDYPTNGSDVWLVVRHRKDEDHEAAEHYLDELRKDGCGFGSRVTLEIIPTETVRAGEIAAARSLVDKLRVFAANSGENGGCHEDKPITLEAEARASGQAGEGLHIRIDRLRLRGAIGIWKGLGQDEIELDLNRFDPGLIALIGENGRGKSTLIENMHPYPEMLTRPGKLQDHFRLRDSYRDLRFTDERTGGSYRALILIDGQNATGKAEYHLYRDGQPLTNGRKEDYEAKVQELFGSLALFVRSAFVSQKPPKNHPDLTDATKGEKKALFRELAGLDYLQAYSESAREKAKALQAETEREQGRIQAIEELVAGSGALEDKLADLQVDRDEKAEALALLEDQGREARAVVEGLKAKVDRNREIQGKIEDLAGREAKLRAEQTSVAEQRLAYERALTAKPAAEKDLAEYQALKDEEAKLHAEEAAVLKNRENLLAQHRREERAVEDRRREIETKQAQLDREVAVLVQKKETAIDRVDELETQLATQIECPACHHQFHPDAEAVREKIARAQEAGYELDKELTEKTEQIAAFDLEKAKILDPVPLELPEFAGAARLREIAGRLAPLDEPRARRILATAAEAEVRIQEGQKRQEQIAAQLKELGEERGRLTAQLDTSGVEQTYEAQRKALEALEQRYRTDRDELKALEASTAGLGKQLDELGQKAGELLQLKVAVEQKQADAAEWRWLERACGPDGIQALELDAMGPGIAQVANQLLAAAYGSRFAIEFRTTRIGGAGSKKKQIEDFQIVVLDSERGTEQLMETLSGGEVVWIRKALYDAFGIMRDRSTGQRFLTVFLDEADGQLDPGARVNYFRLLEAAHQESGRRHTIVITHSTEAQEQIPQQIRMEDLAKTPEAVTA